jgi:hypothetical protein
MNDLLLRRAAKVLGWSLIVFAVVMTAIGPFGNRADATEQGEPVCATWKLRGATGQYPVIVFGGAPAGASVESSSSVKLVKPTEGVMPGVEFAAYDVDVSVVNETTLSVSYTTGDGAATSAGAIRLFGYAEQDADTINDAPDWVDVAEGDSGTLVLTLPAGSELGTVGLVYDASNSAAGWVRFEDMGLGNRPVSFTDCPEPTPTATATPAPTVTASSSASATAGPGTSPPAGSDDQNNSGGGGLPVTGAKVSVVIVTGLLLLAAGLGLAIAARRRKVRYIA